MTIEEILELAKNRELETVHVEFKSWRVFDSFEDKTKDSIACSIIAFANRFGGKIIFGVNNDGIADIKFSKVSQLLSIDQKDIR